MTRYGEQGRTYGEEQEILDQFFDWADQFPNPLFIAQNASFDLKFLNVRSKGKLPKYPVLDTMQLMQYYLVPLLKTQIKAEEGNQEAQDQIRQTQIQVRNYRGSPERCQVPSKGCLDDHLDEVEHVHQWQRHRLLE